MRNGDSQAHVVNYPIGHYPKLKQAGFGGTGRRFCQGTGNKTVIMRLGTEMPST